MTANTEATFWANVDRTAGPDACWPWMAYRTPRGYGRFTWRRAGSNRRTLAAHRLALELTIGEIPAGLFACHTCDNPPCCNPRHLYAGTPLQNSADCLRRDRAAVADRHPRAKITSADAEEIRRLNAAGTPKRVLARRFGLDPKTVRALIQGLTWKARAAQRGGPDNDGAAFPPAASDAARSRPGEPLTLWGPLLT